MAFNSVNRAAKSLNWGGGLLGYVPVPVTNVPPNKCDQVRQWQAVHHSVFPEKCGIGGRISHENVSITILHDTSTHPSINT
jgi:hypothetical protein